MSSGSSGSSGDEAALPPDVRGMAELAQICHFFSTFRAPLKLSKFSRTELEEALIEASSGHDNHVALLAEIHFKLAREQMGVKLEKMMLEWEKAVAKKLAESWHLEFDTNPMPSASYSELSVPMRIRILNALCHWKVDSCAEIRKHIAAIQKDGDSNGLDSLRAQEIGYDDNGVSYWYFDDGCWVYAEDKPQWQALPKNPRYVVEFATAKKIRLSINFDCDNIESNVDVKINHGEVLPKANLAIVESDMTKQDISEIDVVARKEAVTSESPVIGKIKKEMVETRKMDISVLCGSPQSSDKEQVKADCTVETQVIDEIFVAHSMDTRNETTASITLDTLNRVNANDKQNEISESMQVDEKTAHKRNGLDLEQDGKLKSNDDDASKSQLESVSSGKKRFIIDDDTTDSGKDSDCGANAKTSTKSKRASPMKKKVRLDNAMELSSDSLSRGIDVLSGDITIQDPSKGVSTSIENVAIIPTNNPTLTTADSENFDIICECCSKDYDMRYLDPPLVERPGGEWRCFECLVNDARGWPRRRKPSPRGSVAEEDDTKPKSSSSKKKSSSSSSKKSSKSSSSSKSKHRSSNHQSSSNNKKSSSSKKKHKKKKSSSSSSHHSHRHHRRRHHHQDFAKLLSAFQTRKNERLAIETFRISGGHTQIAEVDGPTSWRVVSSTLEDLRSLVSRLAGGSLDQERLKGRLISILKNQERIYEEQKKQQELALQVLPRRQSSRIAIGKIRTQYSHDDSDVDAASSGGEGEHTQTRSTRTRTSASNDILGYDSKQRLALERASRARRRQRQVGSDIDIEEEDDEDTPSAVEGWIDWSLIKSKKSSLSTVCLALVDRLLKEDIAELFARPVDPELDGCPHYLSVIEHPIDLGTIRSRLQNGFYQAWEIFKMDIDRVWQNCRAFNDSDTVVVQYANTLDGMCQSMYSAAEKKGARKMKNKNSDAESSEDENDDSGSSSNESKADSKGSANKEWTESSSSGSSGSSDGGASSDNSSGSNDSDHKARRQSRSTVAQSKRTRSSNGTPNGISQRRSSRQKHEHSSTGKVNPERASSKRRPLNGTETTRLQKPERKVPNISEDAIPELSPALSVEREKASSSLKQPEAPVSRLKKTRQISSSSSSSDNDEKDSSSESDASMNSDNAESDAEADHPPPPPPSAPTVKAAEEIKQAAAPPPPPPPSPPASTTGSSQPRQKNSHRSGSSPAPIKHGRKMGPRATALKPDLSSSAGQDGRTSGQFANSPSLLNSYLSPSSSSSSYFSSSADSNSSDSANSDSDSE